jgi:hypothetical protein
MNQLRKKALFIKYSTDLARFRPAFAGLYQCPICMKIFSADAIASGELTDGHVWPAKIRELSNDITQHQHVLLCHSCNSKLGQQGDAHMQNFTLVRQGQKSGELHGTQYIEAFSWDTGEKAVVRGIVKLKDGNEIGEIALIPDINNPSELNKFNRMAHEGDSMTMLIRNEKAYRVEHAPVGWTTSAYLYAFRHLGYRYILQKPLNEIRKYIQQSFLPENRQQEIPYPETLGFRTGTVTYLDGSILLEPQIFIAIPIRDRKAIHLEVNLLDFSTCLPINVEAGTLYRNLSRVMRETQIQLSSEQEDIAMWFNCNRIENERCFSNKIISYPI